MDFHIDATRDPDKSYWGDFDEAHAHAKRQMAKNIGAIIGFDRKLNEYTVTGWKAYTATTGSRN
jgi:hypothetical protein